MRMLLELDPNVVKPGYIPLLITVGLALVMVLLFRSMRRHFRRVDAFYPETTGTEDAAGVGPTGASDTTASGDRPTGTAAGAASDDQRAPSR